MKLVLGFIIWLMVVCLLSGLWIKALPSVYGLIPFIASLMLGIAVGVSVLGGIDEGQIRTIADAKRAVFDGGSLFVEWSAYLLGALLLGAVGFFFMNVASHL